MSLYEATFRVKHECPYRTISEQNPDLTIREWFMNEHQILELSAPATRRDELSAEIDALGPVLFETSEPDSVYAVVRSSLCSLDSSLISRFEEHNCLYMPPTTYRRGWEHYTVTAFDDRNVRALLRDLDSDREIDVTSTNSVETRRIPHSQLITADTLFAGMTPRQRKALLIALDNGYFDQPRGASVEELSTQTNVSRSTYEEHLRKAQNKLIRNTENFLRLLTEGDDEGELRTGPMKRSTA